MRTDGSLRILGELSHNLKNEGARLYSKFYVYLKSLYRKPTFKYFYFILEKHSSKQLPYFYYTVYHVFPPPFDPVPFPFLSSLVRSVLSIRTGRSDNKDPLLDKIQNTTVQ